MVRVPCTRLIPAICGFDSHSEWIFLFIQIFPYDLSVCPCRSASVPVPVVMRQTAMEKRGGLSFDLTNMEKANAQPDVTG